MRVDPIRSSRGVNSYYLYAMGNPKNYYDERGLLTASGKLDKDYPNNTIVCDGRGGIMPYLAPGGECFKDCSRAHENIHIEDALRINNNICKGKDYMTRIWWEWSERAPSERRACNKSLVCLKAKKTELKCTDPDSLCIKKIEDEINRVQEYAQQFM